MRKFTFAFGAVCTVAAAAFLGACSKDSDCCKDKDKASVQTDSMATPAGSSKCSGKCDSGCKDKAAGKCTGMSDCSSKCSKGSSSNGMAYQD